MLTSRIQVILLLIFILLFYIYSDTYFSLLILIMTIATLLFSGISTLYIKNKLEFSLSSSGSMNKNEFGSLCLEAKNNTILPIAKLKCFLLFHNRLTGETGRRTTVLSLNGKAFERIHLETRSEYCGEIEISLKTVTFYDLLGIFSASVKTKVKTNLYVLPGIYFIDVVFNDLSTENIGESMNSLTTKSLDSGDIFGIKEYVPGDNVKHLHWNLTSKFDKLIVKELSEPVEHSYLVLLETSMFDESHRDDPEVLDAMMETFLSISTVLLDNGQAHSIGWFDHTSEILHIEDVYSIDNLTSLLRDLLTSEKINSKHSTLEQYLQTKANSLFSTVVYITSEQSAGFLDHFDIGPEMTILSCDHSAGEENKITNAKGIVFTPDDMEEELRQLTI